MVMNMDQTMQVMETAPSINREHMLAIRAAKEPVIEVRASLDNIRWELHGQLVTLYRMREVRQTTSRPE